MSATAGSIFPFVVEMRPVLIAFLTAAGVTLRCFA
jgi:hypothetical protein